MQRDMKTHLRDQIAYMRTSAAAFDDGNKAEAIRIGAILRVIFHQPPPGSRSKSTSLLTHLGASDVLIRSNAPSNDGNLLFGWSLAIVKMGFGADKRPIQEFQPHLAPESSDSFLKAPDWWDQIFAAMNGVQYTRQKVTRWAADKDGGAHIDATLPPDYAALKEEGAFITFISSEGLKPNTDAHYAFLRTMATEVLHSPALQALFD